MDVLQEVSRSEMRTDLPAFVPGDTLRVNVRVREGEKERIQAFEGVCIARKNGGITETFTVRKISSGIGVERVFPMHSPSIADAKPPRMSIRASASSAFDATTEATSRCCRTTRYTTSA